MCVSTEADNGDVTTTDHSDSPRHPEHESEHHPFCHWPSGCGATESHVPVPGQKS